MLTYNKTALYKNILFSSFLNCTITTASKAHFCVLLLYLFIKAGLLKETRIFCQKLPVFLTHLLMHQGHHKSFNWHDHSHG